MKSLRLYWCIAICASLAFHTAKAQDPSHSVVQVYAGAKTIGIGFLWQDQYHIVTALHVVAGRSNFKVRSFAPGRTGFYRVAEVEKVLKEADLALIRLEEPIDVPVLTVSSEPPSDTKRYYNYRPSPGGTKMAGHTTKVESKVEKLSFFFNSSTPELYTALRRQGYPQVSADIARVITPVRKGDSGSPICDEYGRLVGIVDGGLYNGLRAYNWAIIAASYLDELASSNNTESFASVKANNPDIYLVTDNVESSQPLEFANGRISLEKVFSTTLGQINATLQLDEEEMALVDEYYGLVTELSGKYLANAVVDVYQDWATGATIAIPHGMKLTYSETEDESVFLSATSPSGNVDMLFVLEEEIDIEIGDLFKEFILNLYGDDAWDWEWELEDYFEYEEAYGDYKVEDFTYVNGYGGEAAITSLHSQGHFMGLAAYVIDYENATAEDEYYYQLLHECVQLSDFPAH